MKPGLLALALTTALTLTTAAAPTGTDLERQVQEIAAKNSVWKQITWRTCLLEGLAEARAKKKPVLLWVFIHNPNFERC